MPVPRVTHVKGVLQIFDHFQWHYNSAIAQAYATTIAPQWEDYMGVESPLQSMMWRVACSSASTLFSYILLVIAFFGVKTGDCILRFTSTSQNSVVSKLYRLAVNLFFFYFTIPMYILTHLTYYLGL
jgi:hypothetical protein